MPKSSHRSTIDRAFFQTTALCQQNIQLKVGSDIEYHSFFVFSIIHQVAEALLQPSLVSHVIVIIMRVYLLCYWTPFNRGKKPNLTQFTMTSSNRDLKSIGCAVYQLGTVFCFVKKRNYYWITLPVESINWYLNAGFPASYSRFLSVPQRTCHNDIEQSTCKFTCVYMV